MYLLMYINVYALIPKEEQQQFVKESNIFIIYIYI